MSQANLMILSILALTCSAALPDCPGHAPEETPPDGDVIDEPAADAPGQRCICDHECRDEAGAEGICVFGVCMTRPLTATGTEPECPPSMVLREIYEYGGLVCFPLCDAFECRGDCDRDGVCIDTEDTDSECDPTCSSYSSDDSVEPPSPSAISSCPERGTLLPCE